MGVGVLGRSFEGVTGDVCGDVKELAPRPPPPLVSRVFPFQLSALPLFLPVAFLPLPFVFSDLIISFPPISAVRPLFLSFLYVHSIVSSAFFLCVSLNTFSLNVVKLGCFQLNVVIWFILHLLRRTPSPCSILSSSYY